MKDERLLSQQDVDSEPAPLNHSAQQRKTRSEADAAKLNLVELKSPEAKAESDWKHFDFKIAHSIPGRLRLKVAEFRLGSEYERQFLHGLQTIKGIYEARTNRLTACVTIKYDESQLSQESLLEQIGAVDFSALVDTPQQAFDLVKEGGKTLIARGVELFQRIAPPVVQVGCSAAALLAAIFNSPLTVPLTCLAGLPILHRATTTAVTERRISVDGLDGMAALLMIGHSQFRAATFMMTLIACGEYIRELSAKNCQRIVDDLLGMAGCSAWLVKGKKRECVPAEQIKTGDQIVVYPGELIPVDGVVYQGEGLVNQASMTGESVPVEITAEHNVLAATILVQGQIYVTCTSPLKSSKALKVIDLINTAPLSETKIQNYAANLADKAVMPLISAAFLTFGVTRDPARLMSMMIYDFSTGIRIAAPTAVLASMARAGKLGILIKSGVALEKMARVDAIVFDKTGTLTSGNPHVTRVESVGKFTKDELLAMAAAVENRLSHPAAQAIVAAAVKKKLDIPHRSGASHSIGLGVAARVGEHEVSLGSRTMMTKRKVDVAVSFEWEKSASEQGQSLVYVAVDGELAGCIAYMDTIRSEAVNAIRRLHRRGVRKLVMATGDTESSARRIADELGVDEIISRAFPESKAALVQELKAQGYVVAVVGDGINDSPALAHADVAISLQSATAAAREHADIILMDDDLTRLADGIDIARGAMRLIKETTAVVAVANGAGLALTAVGLVGPAGATLLNNGSAIAVALNSLRPLVAPTLLRSRRS